MIRFRVSGSTVDTIDRAAFVRRLSSLLALRAVNAVGISLTVTSLQSMGHADGSLHPTRALSSDLEITATVDVRSTAAAQTIVTTLPAIDLTALEAELGVTLVGLPGTPVAIVIAAARLHGGHPDGCDRWHCHRLLCRRPAGRCVRFRCGGAVAPHSQPATDDPTARAPHSHAAAIDRWGGSQVCCHASRWQQGGGDGREHLTLTRVRGYVCGEDCELQLSRVRVRVRGFMRIWHVHGAPDRGESWLGAPARC